MFGTPRISSIFLLALGTALATVTAVNAETDPSLPERVLVGKASLKAELYSRADPLNLFGLQRPRHDPRDDVVGQVIDQTWAASVAQAISAAPKSPEAAPGSTTITNAVPRESAATASTDARSAAVLALKTPKGAALSVRHAPMAPTAK
ncbi:unnamed protein product [Tilletia caries]|nr:unnamed protein product [Tilletia caries]CAD6917306.1 unnamed protein product [Tilletia controversa]